MKLPRVVPSPAIRSSRRDNAEVQVLERDRGAKDDSTECAWGCGRDGEIIKKR